MANNEPRTDYEKGPEYARVLRDVLSVIDGMRPSETEVYQSRYYDGMDIEDEDQIAEVRQEWQFGPFSQYGQFQPDSAGYESRAVIEWPDLDLIAGDIRKVLGS